jgi:hypothetical protein
MNFWNNHALLPKAYLSPAEVRWVGVLVAGEKQHWICNVRKGNVELEGNVRGVIFN